MKLIKLDSIWQVLSEDFNRREIKKIIDMVKKCFKEKGMKGVQDYDTLNKYLGKLNFEVDVADIQVSEKYGFIYINGTEWGKLNIK